MSCAADGPWGSGRSSTAGSGGIPSDLEHTPQAFPLSYGQRALWYVQKVDPMSTAHTVAHSGRLLYPIDPALLRQVFQQIIDAHPILRTTFTEIDGALRQVVHPYQDVHFQHYDATSWDRMALHACVREEMYRPFDLEHGPLFRVTLLTESPSSHILLLVWHHTITDLWSCALILNEFSARYMERATGRAIPLPVETMQYHDVVDRELTALSGQEGERLWEFWKDYLKGEIEPLGLQTDWPRPVRSAHRGSTESIRLSPELSAQLVHLGKSHKAMTYVTVLAAYAALLHRYSGKVDLVIGTPKAIRNRATANTLGYLINPVPVRIPCAGDPSFSEFLRCVRDSAAAAFAHGTFPFPLLVERMQHPRDSSRSPVFQVMFSWQKTIGVVDADYMTAVALADESTGHQMNGMPVGGFEQQELPVPFDLTLMAVETKSGQIVLTFEFDQELFERATVKRMLHDLRMIVESVVASPHRRLSECALLSPQEQHEALALWSAPGEQEEPAALVTAVIEKEAMIAPEATALLAGSQAFSRQTLNERANQLAWYLQSSGVGPEVPVGVFLERSPELMIAILALLKVGGVFVPIDPTFPTERVRFILEDTGAPLVITRSSLLDRLPAMERRWVCLDREASTIADLPPQAPPGDVGGEHGAYVIYTSGSTGTPKGVLVDQRALADHCRDMQRYYGLGPNDRVLQFASPNFDASLEQILPAFMSGATLVLRDEDLWSPREFLRKCDDLELTVINIPPSYWHQLAHEWSEEDTRGEGSRVRLVIIGGDVMRDESLKLWNATPGRSARLLNAYGPTETTITALTHEIPREGVEQYPWKRIPIGRPLRNRRIYVLDSHLQPVPFGVPGELFIAGAGMGRGYLNRPALTAERFLPDPFGPKAGARMYRTGDLVTYRQDGIVEFHGRLDQQVKVRGFRVELEEIETTIARMPEVAEVAVVTRDESDVQKEIVAFVVGRSRPIASPEVKSWCARFLPSFMVPGVVVPLDVLPHSPGGKIDRRALPLDQAGAMKQAAKGVPPETTTEKEVALLWEQLLNTAGVGVHDDFFELGGHSLLATQMASRLEAHFHIEIPLREILAAPTVAGLASLIEQRLIEHEDHQELSHLLDEVEGMDLPETDRRSRGATAR